MDRFNRLFPAVCVACVMTVCSIGCGSKSGEMTAASQSPNSPAGAQASAAVASPTDVVSQFLDLIRRGGEDSGAGLLLTATAQSELARIGRTVQPIGSPDAKYTVTRATDVPGQPDASLVHCIWQEPTATGGTEEYQVVWALQREAAGWRISGLAMELDPNEDPMIVDFEDGARMAKLLAEPAEALGSGSGTF
jgi:hypothetical protein